MGNFNIKITTVGTGQTRLLFADSLSRGQCQDWLDEMAPAQIGEKFQLVNLSPPKRKYPDHIEVTGYDENNEVIAFLTAGVKHANGKHYTVRMAKRDARAKGAKWFKTRKVWDNAQPEHSQELLQT